MDEKPVVMNYPGRNHRYGAVRNRIQPLQADCMLTQLCAMLTVLDHMDSGFTGTDNTILIKEIL